MSTDKSMGAMHGRTLTGADALAAIANPGNRRFKPARQPKRPKDIAALLEFSADRADEISLSDDGLVGGTEMLRIAAAEIRRLRSDTVEPGKTRYVQLATRDGEMVLHAEVTAEGGPRIVLREGRKTTLLFERQ